MYKYTIPIDWKTIKVEVHVKFEITFNEMSKYNWLNV